MYTVRTIGDELKDTFPYAVFDPDGTYVNAYTHRQIAEDVALRLNTGYQPTTYEDVTEADEQMPSVCPWLPHDTANMDPDTAYHACRNYYGF